MGQIYYWKGQKGMTGTSANTLQLGLNHDNRHFIGKQNNWNLAANWAVPAGGTGGYNDEYDQGGESQGGHIDPPAQYFITPATWPKAGDSVVFDKIQNAFLDGASGMSGETWPYTECLYGGTTGDNKWFDGSSTAGKLEKLTIGEGYGDVLFRKERHIGSFTSTRGTAARLGINMVNGHCSTYGASGPNEGLGLYVAEYIDNCPCVRIPEVHTHHYMFYDWLRSRNFSTNTHFDSMTINGAGNYNFYQDELQRGCTITNLYLNRNPDWSQMGQIYKERATFKMIGNTNNYSINLFKDTCSKLTQTFITSRTTIPNVIVGSAERNSSYAEPPLTIAAHVGKLRTYPSDSSGASSGYQSGFSPSTPGFWTYPPQSCHLDDYKGFNATVVRGYVDGVSGASGPGIGTISGISLGILQMDDVNPFFPNAGRTAGGTGQDAKNFNNVMLDLAQVPANAGATITQLKGYSGFLYPDCKGLTGSVPYRILTGEINNKIVVMGFDYENEPWIGFEIAGHTLGIVGAGTARNGLKQLANDCDVRLVRGARISTTTAKADQDAILTQISPSFNAPPSKGGG